MTTLPNTVNSSRRSKVNRPRILATIREKGVPVETNGAEAKTVGKTVEIILQLLRDNPRLTQSGLAAGNAMASVNGSPMRGGPCEGCRMALLGTNAQPSVISALRECMPEGLAGDC